MQRDSKEINCQYLLVPKMHTADFQILYTCFTFSDLQVQTVQKETDCNRCGWSHCLEGKIDNIVTDVQYLDSLSGR